MTRKLVLVVVGLVMGLVGGGLTVSALADDRAAAPVTVCVTGKGVVRSADARGVCPRRTTKRRVGAAGPRGPAGPGAVPLRRTLQPSASPQTVSLGGFTGQVTCTDTDELHLRLDETAIRTMYGTLAAGGIGPNGGENDLSAIAYRSGADFVSYNYQTFYGEMGLDVTVDVFLKGIYDLRVALFYDSISHVCRLMGTSTLAPPA